ncbi:hypothetical protein [Sedimentitalea nanhaiensis]|uniref:Uncharacterized protein n=1 Tax=Sedimentitalea nanhaiensis TaxID=999627 RepID=A0A1I7C2X8_9RHOB|nr:hypothetical protein [Sedimentitalea nanhaiensis]SFT93761.1 hypothetical protein SAMN05216236_1145 [Sedimentitalea nanhaiensis]
MSDTAKRPPNPYVVLAVASVLTGMGQVINGQAARGLMMAFTALSLAWVTYNLTTPDHSFVGRYAGGLMIQAIALMDAYRVARFRWETWHQTEQPLR